MWRSWLLLVYLGLPSVVSYVADDVTGEGLSTNACFVLGTELTAVVLIRRFFFSGLPLPLVSNKFLYLSLLILSLRRFF